MRDWYSIKAQADSAEVYIYEMIGEGLFEEGITAKRFAQDLAALDVSSIALHINSPGGSVFEGQAIYNAIARHPAAVTTYIDGVAASIASVVALAGDRVVMARNALFMIHDPFALGVGTAEDHRRMADMLDQVAGTIVTAYQDKTGKPVEEITAAMAAETWYSADEALDFGFVDEVAEPMRVAAAAGYQVFDLAALGYRHAPAPKAIVPALEDGMTAQEAIEKAQAVGRVLSAANETDLRQAADLITGVLAKLDSTAEPPAEDGATAQAAEASPSRRRVWTGDRFVTFSKHRED